MKNLKYAIHQSEADVRRCADDIRDRAMWLIEKLEKAKQGAKELRDMPHLPESTGLNLNPLGVLQAQGVAFDVACGKLEVELKVLKELRRLQD